MAVNIWLTDEDSDIAGYLRAKLSSRSDNPSHVRSVTNTIAGPSSGEQATRTAAGTALAWITDPLDGTDLTAAAWTLHLWAKESNAAANAALRFQVLKYTNAEGATALDSNAGTELTTTIADVQITTAAATVTTMADGDRLVFKVLFDDAGTMAAGYTCTLSYNGQYARAEGDSYVTCPDTLVITAAAVSATRTRVRRYLKDTATTNPLLTDAEVDQAVEAAVRTYSHDRPLVVVGALSGTGSATDFTLPRLWIHGFSALKEIEYPTGAQWRTVLEPGDWEIRDSALGFQPTRKLHFRQLTPESGTDNVLVAYTTRHVHNDETDTIPQDDFEAFVWLAAAFAADTLGAKMAAASDSIITADSVNYRDGQQRWASVAKNYRKLYEDHMGQGDATPQPALALADWDTSNSAGGDHLFHSRRRR